MDSLKTNDETTKMCPTQKMSHRKWKAMMRKQKRRTKRQLEEQQKPPDRAGSVSESEDEAALQAQEEERQHQHQLWLEREKKAEEEWLAKQEREKKEKERKLEAERKIREEWEEQQKKEKEEEEEREKIEREKKEKQIYTGTQPTQVPLKNVAQLLQQATANDNKDAWHNPIAPTVYGKERDQCPFFMKTGACRFAERCSRSHTYPESSCTIMLPGMFANFRLEQSLVDENDTDLALEYDDKELYENFTEFYNDVLPEFRSMGRVTQFKVSCNCEPHLRGNVYVQYRREDDAQKAFVKFNGRWYGGRQITCVFITIARWKSAICGQSFVKRCPKGKSCNFLHVFRNPGNEFWLADKDYEMSERDHRSSDQRDSHHRYGSERRDRYAHRDRFDHNGRDKSHDSRYRSRRHDRSRSRSPKLKGGNRSRSRSPSRSRRKRSRSRSRKSRSPSRSVRHRSGSRSPKSRRLKHRKSRSPESKTTRRNKSQSKSPSRLSKRRSRSKGRRSTSPSHSMENVQTSSNGQSNGTHKARRTESSTDSDSETSRSSRSVSKTNHKKSKKHKKHKHKSHKKKNLEKDKTKAKVICKSISDPESSEDHNGKINIIEIPQDSGDEDLGDVIFEDVYV